ncbi:MAG: hypothetical protein J0M12_09600, partial [Deltaproteobacteria bacterium]|nr:hypothetical protein [Deltaproteobacteria bacterium]
DREVVVDGPVNVRLLSRGRVEIGQSSFGSTTQVVPTGRVVSLTEHALDRSGIRLRAADSPEMTRFPNTLVGLWMHIPSMDETLKVQLDTAISRRKSATTLNVLIEQVTQDDSIRGALGIYYNRQLKAPKEAHLTLSTGVLDLDPEEQTGSHAASIIKVIREVAEKHGLEPQVHYVDFNLSASTSETLRKWIQKANEWQKCAVQDGSKLQALKPTPREAILTLARQYSEASSASFNEREALVAKQMRRFALAPTDGAVNVLLVGAAHQKVLEALPGAKQFYVRIPIEFKTVLSARVYDSLSRIRDPFEHMWDITDRGGKIPEPLARQGFLFTRLNSLMEYVMPEILRPSRECKIIWDGGLHQVAATVMSSCLTPAESRVLFLAALNPKNDRKQPEILIDWIANKFDLDLRPHKTDLNTFVRTIGTKAAAQIK